MPVKLKNKSSKMHSLRKKNSELYDSIYGKENSLHYDYYSAYW